MLSFDEFDVRHVQHEPLGALALRSQEALHLQRTPKRAAASSFACVSNAMAATSAWTLRLPPASSCSDSCASLNSTAATPAGV